MRRLFEVDLKDYDGCSRVFRRPSARAIIFRGDKIALVYATNEKYYKFPGGGIHDDEDKKLALIREVKEETGLNVIPGSIAEYGSVLRRQKSDREEDTIFEQENYYYLCETEDMAGSQNLDDYEREAGFMLVYADIDEAIRVNGEYKSDVYFNEVMIGRDKRVLELIKADMENKTNNPWEEISLDDYENHMSLDSVKQLHTMNSMMKEQFGDYPVNSAMVLGVAGGNGLEHVDKAKYQTVYGVDINEEYLRTVAERYASLSGVLKCIKADLINESDKLPHADMIIANLLIEYIGYDVFKKAVKTVDPQFVSCVIQINTDARQWVSESPYIHAFDRLDEVHHQMEEDELESAMKDIRYSRILCKREDLPNGKALVRIDFQKDQ